MDLHARALALLVLGGACACGRGGGGAPANAAARDTVVLFVAASLTRPLQPLVDATTRGGGVVQRESGASLDHARKLTELGRIPDVLVLADYEVFPDLLVPRFTSWYAEFARNRMVVAYTDRSRYASAIDSASWTRILSRPDVQVGRTDPDIAPVGYRTLLMLELAEQHYRQPGLARRLVANAPRRNMRPDAAQLAALLEAGELDYIYDYESVAIAHGFRYLRLPPAIDLSDPARAADYASARVRVRGTHPGDTVTIVGQPILYALSVPAGAPHPAAAARFVATLLSPEGRAMLHAAHVDALPHAVFVGPNAPPAIRAAAAR